MGLCAGHQVGRLQPLVDAAAVLHIREAVGRGVELRADANQRWSLSEALQFGHAVKAAGLQVLLPRLSLQRSWHTEHSEWVSSQKMAFQSLQPACIAMKPSAMPNPVSI